MSFGLRHRIKTKSRRAGEQASRRAGSVLRSHKSVTRPVRSTEPWQPACRLRCPKLWAQSELCRERTHPKSPYSGSPISTFAQNGWVLKQTAFLGRSWPPKRKRRPFKQHSCCSAGGSFFGPGKMGGGAADPKIPEAPVLEFADSCRRYVFILGPPAIGALSYCFFFVWEGSPTIIDYRKTGTLILTSLLEDPVCVLPASCRVKCCSGKPPTSQPRSKLINQDPCKMNRGRPMEIGYDFHGDHLKRLGD